MNPELYHQLYGGDISDYLPKTAAAPFKNFGAPEASDNELAHIYNTQIKGKPSIDTSGLGGIPNMSSLIQKDNRNDPLNQLFQQTLNKVAHTIGLVDDLPDYRPLKLSTIKLNTQTDSDIAAAAANVMQALKELQELNAV
jgi:hypothetical protein